MIKIYERSDERMPKQRHWYLSVAAAQIISNANRADALSVLETTSRDGPEQQGGSRPQEGGFLLRA